MNFLSALLTNVLARLAGAFASWIESRRKRAALMRAIEANAKDEAAGVVDAKNEDELEKAARDLLSRT